MIWVLGYISSIVLANVLFAHHPEHSAWWALIVGLIFVVRDFAQRALGMVGILTPELFALQVASKMAGALLVSFGIWKRRQA